MSLRSPSIPELKTELLAILDFIQPSVPVKDASGNVIRPRNAIRSQGDEVRSALTANMFADLLEKIGRMKPSEIEVSARFLEEIVRLIDDYERTIAPLVNLSEGENSIVQALRNDVAALVDNSFPGLSISTNLADVPNSIVEAVLSPFYPQARGLGNTQTMAADDQYRDRVGKIWGTIRDFSTVANPNFLIRNDPYGRRLVDSDGRSLITPESESETTLSASPESPIDRDQVNSNIRRSGTPRDLDTEPRRGIAGGSNTVPRGGGSRGRTASEANEPVDAPSGPTLSGGTRDRSTVVDSVSPGSLTTTGTGLNDPVLLQTSVNAELLFEPTFPITRFGGGPYVDMETLANNQPFRMLGLSLDWLAQMKATSVVFPDFVGQSDSPHSLLVNEALRGDRLNVAESILFDFTTSKCFKVRINTSAIGIRPPRRARTGTYVTTDKGYTDAFSRATGRIIGTTSLADWLDAPENVLRTDVVTSLRDGFILDTPVAEEEGFENATSNPLNSNEYATYKETVVGERNDIVSSIREIIAGNESPLTAGRPGDFVPGLTAANLVELGVGFKGCKFLAIPRGIGDGLNHDSAVIMASLFMPDPTEAEVRYVGCRVTFGDSWALSCVRSIVQYYVNAKSRNFINDLDDVQQSLIDQIEELETELEGLPTGRLHGLDRLERAYEIIDEINSVYASLGRVSAGESVEFYQGVLDNFPFYDAFKDSVREGAIDETDVSKLTDPVWFVGTGAERPTAVNFVSSLDPTFSSEVTSGELDPSELLDAIDDTMIELIRDCAARIQAMGPNLSLRDIGNYAYMYFITAGMMARSVLVPTAPRGVSSDRFSIFSNRVLDSTGGVSVLLDTPAAQRAFVEIDPAYGREIGMSSGFEGRAPEGSISDPMQASIDFVDSLSVLLTQALPSAFATATESVNRSSQALRTRFGRTITISSSDINIPLNMLDFLLETTDFREFASRARSFVNLESLTPVALLASNDIDSGLSMLQFALYTLTESRFTRLENVNYGDFIIPYNKVAAFGVPKGLMSLIERLPVSSGAQKIRRGQARLRILERQLDPSPSTIDEIVSGDDPLFRGSRFLQAIDSAGQPEGGWPCFMDAKLDYTTIADGFSLASPIVRLRYMTASPSGEIAQEELQINLKNETGEYSTEEGRELAARAKTFIRSEALKIYYYFMTGFIFEPDFAPSPDADDTILVENLISTDPIVRLQSLVDVFINSSDNQFGQIVLIPFVSDNDSIEEFTGIIRFDT